jgi:hypothetical protein
VDEKVDWFGHLEADTWSPLWFDDFRPCSLGLISYSTVFFSHNKSANNTFQPEDPKLEVLLAIT